MNTKVCACCHVEKDLTEFYKNKARPDGVQTYCKPCMAARNKAWVHNNPEAARNIRRSSYERNKESVCEQSKAWAASNPEKRKEAQRKSSAKRRELFPDVVKEINRRSRLNNLDKRREYDRLRYAIDPEKRRESCRKWQALNADILNGYSKARKAAKLQAIPKWADMSKINSFYKLAKERGLADGGEWHVDHIVPLVSQLVCGLHVEHNLQVIPAVENLRKHNRVWPDMP